MNCAKNVRTFKRAYSIDHQLLSHVSDNGLQLQSREILAPNIMAPSSSNAVAIELPLPYQAPSEPPSNPIHVFPPNSFNEMEHQFRSMSRIELEIIAQAKFLETQKYSYHFKEMQNTCTALQSSLEEEQNSHGQKEKKYADLKRLCERFVSDFKYIAGTNNK